MSRRRVVSYQTCQDYNSRNHIRYVMRRRQRQARMKKRVLMFLLFAICCVICFFFGFQLRGTQTIAKAESRIQQSADTQEGIFFQEETKADPSFPAEIKEERKKYYTSIVLMTGDSLYDIACEYMTEEYDSIDQYITELKQINGMVGNQLQQGDYLMVPYYL